MLRIALRSGISFQRMFPASSPVCSNVSRWQHSIEKVDKSRDSLNAKKNKSEMDVYKDDSPEPAKFNVTSIFDLFINKFDPELLYLPEVLSDEQWVDLVGRGKVLEDELQNVNYAEVLSTDRISPQIRKQLSELNAFKRIIPPEYGGLGLTNTENEYFMEILASRPSLGRLVSESEEMAVRILMLHGSEEQKREYLPKLASGEIKISLAILEEGSTLMDAMSYLNTKVGELDGEYVLKGKKCWVVDAMNADVFMVFGTHIAVDEGGGLLMSSLFLIPRKAPGVLVHKPMQKNWFKGVDVCDVSFVDVTIKAKSVVGGVGDGYNVIKDLFKMSRIHMISECSCSMKKLIHDYIQKSESSQLFDKKLSSYNYVHLSLGELSSLTYAVESLSYYIAARADYFEKPDLTVEVIMGKVFAVDKLLRALEIYFSVIGKNSYEKGSFVEELVQNSHYYFFADDTKNTMKLFTITECLTYAGRHLAERIMKFREPFGNAGLILADRLKQDIHRDGVQLDLNLDRCVHLQMMNCAKDLEYCIKKMQHCAERHLRKHGKKSIEFDYDLLVLSDMLLYIYALIACIARGHKACSLRLPNYMHDVAMAESFSNIALREVKYLSNLMGDHQEELATYQEIGRKALTNKYYLAEHPLMRNF